MAEIQNASIILLEIHDVDFKEWGKRHSTAHTLSQIGLFLEELS